MIVDATRRVADLGTIVLVGEALGRTADMNLYADVHVRGLTLVGVSPPLQHGEFPKAQADDDYLLEACRASLILRSQTGCWYPAPAGTRYRADPGFDQSLEAAVRPKDIVRAGEC